MILCIDVEKGEYSDSGDQYAKDAVVVDIILQALRVMTAVWQNFMQ
jgi:hypothetical protein